LFMVCVLVLIKIDDALYLLY